MKVVQFKPHSSFMVHVVYPICRVIVWPIYTLLGPFRVRGKQNIPRKGGLIVLSNHISDLDPIMVQVACPRPIYFMAKSELFEMAIVKWLANAFRAFPVKRGEPDRKALRFATEVAASGEVVCIFPEGKLSQDGFLQPLLPGVALVAKMAGVQVICCALQRTNAMMPYGSKIPRPAFGWVTATWGEAKFFGKESEPEEIILWAEAEFLRLRAKKQ